MIKCIAAILYIQSVKPSKPFQNTYIHINIYEQVLKKNHARPVKPCQSYDIAILIVPRWCLIFDPFAEIEIIQKVRSILSKV